MNKISKHCTQQLNQLNHIITNCQEFLSDAPEGSLQINKSNNSIQYYWKNNGSNAHGKYIKRSEEKLARLLARKDYVSKILPLALKSQKIIIEYQKVCEYAPLKKVYDSLSSQRQNLIDPFFVTDEDYIIQWKKKHDVESTIGYEIENGLLTEAGDIVRSKSEKIMADKLHMLGIPYLYETPLYLDGYGTVYPDFTVLNKRTRQEYYWEHFGMMDCPDYCERAIKKIETYERNGFDQGERLFTTYETKNHAPNMKVLDAKIRAFFL